VRRWNLPAYAVWVRVVGGGGDPVDGSEVLTDENREAEAVYLGLRTDAGLTLRDGESELVAPWVEAGWARLDGERLRLTATGWLRLDALAATLTVRRSR
jgi:coproporphyrinogen III oxidase-like Fe-S oxidoreductase